MSPLIVARDVDLREINSAKWHFNRYDRKLSSDMADVEKIPNRRYQKVTSTILTSLILAKISSTFIQILLEYCYRLHWLGHVFCRP